MVPPVNTPRPKITLLIPGLGVGGAELQLVHAIPFLVHYYDVHLVLLSDEEALLAQVSLPTDRVSVLKIGRAHIDRSSLWRGIQAAWFVSRTLRRHQIRLLVAHLPLAHWVGRWAAFFSKFSGWTIALVTHHHSIYESPHTLSRKLTWQLLRFSSLMDKETICVSRAVAATLPRVQVATKGRVIYNFVVDDRSSKENPFGRSGFKVVLAGRVEPVKGQTFFLNAITQQLSEEDLVRSSLHIWVLGEGSDLNALQQWVKNQGWSDRVTFLGAVDHAQLLNFLAYADLVVVPSLQEGLGNVAIEAIMLGRNVLASDAGGLPEVVMPGRTGFVFTAGDPRSAADRFRQIVTQGLGVDSEYQRSHYSQNFTVKAHVDGLRECFDSILRHG